MSLLNSSIVDAALVIFIIVLVTDTLKIGLVGRYVDAQDRVVPDAVSQPR